MKNLVCTALIVLSLLIGTASFAGSDLKSLTQDIERLSKDYEAGHDQEADVWKEKVRKIDVELEKLLEVEIQKKGIHSGILSKIYLAKLKFPGSFHAQVFARAPYDLGMGIREYTIEILKVLPNAKELPEGLWKLLISWTDPNFSDSLMNRLAWTVAICHLKGAPTEFNELRKDHAWFKPDPNKSALERSIKVKILDPIFAEPWGEERLLTHFGVTDQQFEAIQVLYEPTLLTEELFKNLHEAFRPEAKDYYQVPLEARAPFLNRVESQFQSLARQLYGVDNWNNLLRQTALNLYTKAAKAIESENYKELSFYFKQWMLMPSFARTAQWPNIESLLAKAQGQEPKEIIFENILGFRNISDKVLIQFSVAVNKGEIEKPEILETFTDLLFNRPDFVTLVHSARYENYLIGQFNWKQLDRWGIDESWRHFQLLSRVSPSRRWEDNFAKVIFRAIDMHKAYGDEVSHGFLEKLAKYLGQDFPVSEQSVAVLFDRIRTRVQFGSRTYIFLDPMNRALKKLRKVPEEVRVDWRGWLTRVLTDGSHILQLDEYLKTHELLMEVTVPMNRGRQTRLIIDHIDPSEAQGFTDQRTITNLIQYLVKYSELHPAAGQTAFRCTDLLDAFSKN